MKYILTDVEGTTTSISFVHNTLFPFSKERLKEFVHKNISKPEIQEILRQTIQTARTETQRDINNEEACDQLLYWIETDRKHPALKSLQGLIWEGGYVAGEIKGHVYEDVESAFKIWTDKGISVGVYSSGSVKAQQLIFEYSTAGNLRPYLSNHFDTAVGNKREIDSYKNICRELNFPAEEILFLSDIKEELDAARSAGMKTIQLVRQKDVVTGDHEIVSNFKEIKF